MKNQMYFLIRTGEDGTNIRPIDPGRLLIDLENDAAEGYCPQILADIPTDPDTNYWPRDCWLIIKGKIVTPNPVEVVKKYVLPED